MVEFTFGADGAIVRQHYVLGDGKAQPGAPGFPRASLVHPVETLEQARQVLKRNTRAKVAHVEFNSMLRPACSQDQPATRSSVFERVVDEVRKYLMDGLAIGTHQI